MRDDGSVVRWLRFLTGALFLIGVALVVYFVIEQRRTKPEDVLRALREEVSGVLAEVAPADVFREVVAIREELAELKVRLERLELEKQ